MVSSVKHELGNSNGCYFIQYHIDYKIKGDFNKSYEFN